MPAGQQDRAPPFGRIWQSAWGRFLEAGRQARAFVFSGPACPRPTSSAPVRQSTGLAQQVSGELGSACFIMYAVHQWKSGLVFLLPIILYSIVLVNSRPTLWRLPVNWFLYFWIPFQNLLCPQRCPLPQWHSGSTGTGPALTWWALFGRSCSNPSRSQVLAHAPVNLTCLKVLIQSTIMYETVSLFLLCTFLSENTIEHVCLKITMHILVRWNAYMVWLKRQKLRFYCFKTLRRQNRVADGGSHFANYKRQYWLQQSSKALQT